MLAICTDRLRCYGVLQHFCVNVAAALLVIAVLPDLLSKLASNLKRLKAGGLAVLSYAKLLTHLK